MLSRTFMENLRYLDEKSNVIWPVVESEDLLFLSSMFAVPLAGASLLMVKIFKFK